MRSSNFPRSDGLSPCAAMVRTFQPFEHLAVAAFFTLMSPLFTRTAGETMMPPRNGLLGAMGWLRGLAAALIFRTLKRPS